MAILSRQDLVAELSEDLSQRRLDPAFELMQTHKREILTWSRQKRLNPYEPGLAFYLAAFIDVGYPGQKLLNSLLAKYDDSTRVSMPLLDVCYLKASEGIQGMEEDQVKALELFHLILSLAPDLGGTPRATDLLVIVHFFVARCYRKEGHYDETLKHTDAAKALALRTKRHKMLAVVRVSNAWAHARLGELETATEELRLAEEELSESGDISVGLIKYYKARLELRRGHYEDADDLFQQAIVHYEKFPYHINIARICTHRAFAKHLVLLRQRTRLPPGQLLQSIETAEGFLVRAEEIYNKACHYRSRHGLTNIEINRGYLALDVQDFKKAEDHAKAAMALASVAPTRETELEVPNNQFLDHLAFARANILLCLVYMGSSHDHRLIRECAEAARKHASKTDLTRLKLRTLVFLGKSWLFENPKNATNKVKAREYYEAAKQLQVEGDVDYVIDELKELEDEIHSWSPGRPTLERLARGLRPRDNLQRTILKIKREIIQNLYDEMQSYSKVATHLDCSPKTVERFIHAKDF